MSARLYTFIYEWPYSVPMCCVLYPLFSWALFFGTGLQSVDATKMGFQSNEQLLGLMLLMSLFPTWLLGCMFVTQRHTLTIARQLNAALAARVVAVPPGYLWLGFLGGMVYALALNVPITHYRLVLQGDGPMAAIFLGQLLVWVFVGWMLAVRLYVGSQFYRYGREVPIRAFEQSSLEPFARVGLLDVAIVFGSMAISTVQSIDAQFRLENYLSALVVAIPASLVLLIRPMWTVHVRLRERKQILQEEIRQRIEQMSESSDDVRVAKLESLLKRRDRVNALHTWPLDFTFWSRLFFYGLIPPLAWLGAALAEVLVERAIGG